MKCVPTQCRKCSVQFAKREDALLPANEDVTHVVVCPSCKTLNRLGNKNKKPAAPSAPAPAPKTTTPIRSPT